MKMSLIMVFLMFSLSALAAFNEVECTGATPGKVITLEIEQPFPADSAFKRGTLTITENGADTTSNFTVSTRVNGGFNEIRYWAGGLTLEVNFWPDQRPRWARKYDSKLRSSDLGNETIKLTCEFPNAF